VEGWNLVSVPWRGLRSFGRKRKDIATDLGYRFPSPGGDYGLSDRVKARLQEVIG